MTPTDRARMESLLPWYVNGRIAADDRSWMDTLVGRDAEARAALDWHLAVRAVVVTDLESLPEDIGLEGLMRRVAVEATHARHGDADGPLARFLAGIAGLFTPRVAAFATALIAVQAAVIGTLVLRPQHDGFVDVRSLAPAGVAQKALQVSFRSGVAERDLRMLLTRIGARMADGPAQLGDYVLVVPEERIDAARRELELSGIVESVAVIDWQAPRRDLRP